MAMFRTLYFIQTNGRHQVRAEEIAMNPDALALYHMFKYGGSDDDDDKTNFYQSISQIDVTRHFDA